MITQFFHPISASEGAPAPAPAPAPAAAAAAASAAPMKKKLQVIRNSMNLTKDQTAAVVEMMDFFTNPKRRKQRFLLLTGSAGTGKTFLVSYIYSLLKDSGGDLTIAFTASTNKAVNVLQATYAEQQQSGGGGGGGQPAAADAAAAEEEDKTLTFNTIHRFMHSQRSIDRNGDFFFKFGAGAVRAGKKKVDIVFIDEISMISDALAQQIAQLKAFPKVVLIGDRAQLPPVDEPESSIFGWNIPTCHLTEIVRYRNNIVKLADQVKQLIFVQARTKLSACQGDGVTLYRDNLSTWLEAYMAHFTTQTTTVVLAYTNDRVRFYNEHLRKKVLPLVSAGKKFAPQEMIMFNNYYQATSTNRGKDDPCYLMKYYTSYQVRLETCDEEVYNIDYTVILETLTQEAALAATAEAAAATAEAVAALKRVLPNKIPIYFIVAEGNYVIRNPLNYQKVQEGLEAVKTTFGSIKGFFHEDTVSLFWDFFYKQMHDVFADVTYGYAMTVHKSQGSTYQRVFIDMKDIIQRNPKERESYQCLYTAITRASSEVHIYY